MNRSIFLIPILIIGLTVSSWSQPEEPKVYLWNFGISTGDILHELFNGENANKAYPAFTFEYAGQSHSMQAGFRMGYNKADTAYDGFQDTEVNEQLSLSGQLAVTKHIFSDKHWLIKAGIQLTGGWSREDIIEDSGFDRVTTRRLQWNAGLGPVVDFRFFVHPRISLGTEASLIYSVTHAELQQLFTNFPDFDNTKETTKGDSVEFVEPATIYLRFHF
jgi:hypothetical protein